MSTRDDFLTAPCPLCGKPMKFLEKLDHHITKDSLIRAYFRWRCFQCQQEFREIRYFEFVEGFPPEGGDWPYYEG